MYNLKQDTNIVIENVLERFDHRNQVEITKDEFDTMLVYIANLQTQINGYPDPDTDTSDSESAFDVGC